LLRKEVKKVLAKINLKDKTPFKITVSLGSTGSLRSKIHIRRPEHFNLLEPELIRDRKITIPNRR